MIARSIAAAALVALAAPAVAQDHSGHMMPGMTMPAAKPKAKPAAKPSAKSRATPAKKAKAAPKRRAATGAKRASQKAPSTPVPAKSQQPAGHEHMDHMQGMDHSSHGAGDDHAGHDMPSMPGMAPMQHDGHTMPSEHKHHPGHGSAMAPVGTALAPGNAPAPAPPTDHYADRDFPGGAMHASRYQMMRENGGQRFGQVMLNLAEAQVRNGRDGYRWDGEGWFGGDIDRGVIKSEGSGSFGRKVESAEVQALYSHAIGPYFDLQAGVRHDFAPTPTRTYAAIGVEGLAPYMFDVEASAFLSTKGELLGRLEGWYDQRFTQRLVLQPRVELNLAAQNTREIGVGSGLSDVEAGLRLRYELAREFAPYVGVSYETKVARTADYARAAGEDVRGISIVAGVRFWF